MKESHLKHGFSAFVRSMQLPEDCVHGNALVSIQGQEHVCIENFKGIVSYTEEEIKVLTKRKQICVAGKRLRIDCYTKDEIEISGQISRIEYL